MHGDMEMQAPDRYGHFPPPPGSFGEGGGPKYGTGVRAFDDVPDSWRPIPTGPIEERRATYTAIKLSAFFFAVPALICMYGLVVLHRMSAREGQSAWCGCSTLDAPPTTCHPLHLPQSTTQSQTARNHPPRLASPQPASSRRYQQRGRILVSHRHWTVPKLWTARRSVYGRRRRRGPSYSRNSPMGRPRQPCKSRHKTVSAEMALVVCVEPARRWRAVRLASGARAKWALTGSPSGLNGDGPPRRLRGRDL
mmetsp:Transcript_74211/g.211793  ORF Transcript_74211/g.211793 Transcript_74211/m.211793 type:complete len:251 (-) Transcript_74211:19-771(-)